MYVRCGRELRVRPRLASADTDGTADAHSAMQRGGVWWPLYAFRFASVSSRRRLQWSGSAGAAGAVRNHRKRRLRLRAGATHTGGNSDAAVRRGHLWRTLRDLSHLSAGESVSRGLVCDSTGSMCG